MTIDAKALQPCPFCGGGAEWREDPGVCNVPFGLVVEHSPTCIMATMLDGDEAITAWNTRTATQELAKLREGLRSLIARLDAGQRPGGGSVVPDNIRALLKDSTQ